MSALPARRPVLSLLSAVGVVAATTAVVLVLSRDDLPAGQDTPQRVTDAQPSAQPSGEPERLEQLTPQQAQQPQQVQQFGKGGPGITPTPPRVLAIARDAVPKQTRFALGRLQHVQKVAVADAGVVKIAGTGLNLLAVDPAEFRSWTPEAVAGEPAVWSALERGELVAETSAASRLGMVLGAEYQVDGGPRLRLAASAALGLKGIDGLVSVARGRELGLAPEVAVLLHGKEGRVGTGGVAGLLGEGAQVIALDGGKAPEPPAAVTPDTPDTPDTPGPPAAGTPGRPGNYLDLYKQAATRCPGLSWTVLAAIGFVESRHGRNNGPSSAGALGPMQFMPATWRAYGVDGDADGKKDIWSPYDAVPGAANYLCANGAGKGGQKLRKAIWFYNHSWSYVDKVMGYAQAYARDYT
ncbi:lytic transglycosylase domain-containing protein [Nonomuraea longicatena]|uniref:lytic transglycosylase domain-containing protein n=1 Tax=Nonomuraea longicatena TaxID=83682 RepID=UPI0031D8C82E